MWHMWWWQIAKWWCGRHRRIRRNARCCCAVESVVLISPSEIILHLIVLVFGHFGSALSTKPQNHLLKLFQKHRQLCPWGAPCSLVIVINSTYSRSQITAGVVDYLSSHLLHPIQRFCQASGDKPDDNKHACNSQKPNNQIILDQIMDNIINFAVHGINCIKNFHLFYRHYYHKLRAVDLVIIIGWDGDRIHHDEFPIVGKDLVGVCLLDGGWIPIPSEIYQSLHFGKHLLINSHV
mmetsp:Transcript_12549/g.18774  ORF Transcript_12549/g.18774 Transcript_12549/m.18774 type:complete len:236 (-) Transcript_12549:1467-2174(-)